MAYYQRLPELRNLAEMRREFQVELGRLSRTYGWRKGEIEAQLAKKFQQRS
jgi:hypothetical protein